MNSTTMMRSQNGFDKRGLLGGILIILVVFSSFSVVSAVNPTVIVLANSIDYELASDFFGFLRNKGINIVRITAKEFDARKSSKVIIILGGPDAPEGVGEVVRQLLVSSEQTNLRNVGNNKVHVKTNRWANRQVIIIIAGSDRYLTKTAHQENKEAISNMDSDNDGTTDLTDVEPLIPFEEKTAIFIDGLETLDYELDNVSVHARDILSKFWDGKISSSTDVDAAFNSYILSTQNIYDNLQKLVPPDKLKSVFSNYTEFIRKRINCYNKMKSEVSTAFYFKEYTYSDFKSASLSLQSAWRLSDTYLSKAQAVIKDLYETNNLAPPEGLTDNINPEPMPKEPVFPENLPGLNIVSDTSVATTGIKTYVDIKNIGENAIENIEVVCVPYSYAGDALEPYGYATVGKLDPKASKSVTVGNSYSKFVASVHCYGKSS